MSQFERWTLALLRISIGWMMFYAGITKVLDPNWSAAGYLGNAKTLLNLYEWLASPSILPVTNFLNEWGLTLLGVSLILGIFVRFSSVLGAVLMFFYYLPILQFPYPNAHAYIVDEHIIYAFALLYLGAVRAGRVAGLERWCSNLSICARFPRLRNWLG